MFFDFDTVGDLKKFLEGVDDDLGIAVPDERIISPEYEEVSSFEVLELWYDGSRYYSEDALQYYDDEEKEGFEKTKVLVIT